MRPSDFSAFSDYQSETSLIYIYFGPILTRNRLPISHFQLSLHKNEGTPVDVRPSLRPLKENTVMIPSFMSPEAVSPGPTDSPQNPNGRPAEQPAAAKDQSEISKAESSLPGSHDYPAPPEELINDIRRRLAEIPAEVLARANHALMHEPIDSAGSILYRAGVCFCSAELYEFRKTLFPPNSLVDPLTQGAPVLRQESITPIVPISPIIPITPAEPSQANVHNGSIQEPASPPAPNLSAQPSTHPTIHPSAPSAGATDLSLNPQPSTLNTAGATLLNDLRAVLGRYLVLPEMAAEALALWVVHTYAFTLRQVTTYIGVVSPEKRCGKTTLLELLGRLANRSLTAANISPSAMFRAIEQTQPTLLIDEADTFLEGRDELAGILNAGYRKGNAYVLRVASPTGRRPGGTSYTSPHSAAPDVTDPSTLNSQPSTDQHDPSTINHHPSSTDLARFSTWCPKVMAAIGRLPDTLADRCIVITMQRKRPDEECERLREFDGSDLTQRCARFVREHEVEIARAHPQIPSTLNDRAADIWEPLFVLADLAGGDWPELARQAAITLSGSAQETASPAGLLFNDIRVVFEACGDDRIFSRELVGVLNGLGDRPWRELRRGKPLSEMWLAMQLRPYGIRPKTIWIGAESAKGYERADFDDAFRRYVTFNPQPSTLNPQPSSPNAAPSSLKCEISNVKSPNGAAENPTPSTASTQSTVKSAETQNVVLPGIGKEDRIQTQFALLMEKLLAAASKSPAEENGSYDI